jgi:hypothetical protein
MFLKYFILEFMAAYSFNNDKNEIQTEDVKIRLNERSSSKKPQRNRCCPCFDCSDTSGNPTSSSIRAIKILVLGKLYLYLADEIP